MWPIFILLVVSIVTNNRGWIAPKTHTQKKYPPNLLQHEVGEYRLDDGDLFKEKCYDLHPTITNGSEYIQMKETGTGPSASIATHLHFNIKSCTMPNGKKEKFFVSPIGFPWSVSVHAQLLPHFISTGIIHVSSIL